MNPIKFYSHIISSSNEFNSVEIEKINKIDINEPTIEIISRIALENHCNLKECFKYSFTHKYISVLKSWFHQVFQKGYKEKLKDQNEVIRGVLDDIKNKKNIAEFEELEILEKCESITTIQLARLSKLREEIVKYGTKLAKQNGVSNITNYIKLLSTEKLESIVEAREGLNKNEENPQKKIQLEYLNKIREIEDRLPQNLLNQDAPSELLDLVSSCVRGDELVKKLEDNPTRLLEVLQNMRLDGNEALAARLLYKVSLSDLEKIQTLERTLRNRGVLDKTSDPDFSIKEEGYPPIRAHKVILALKSPYFQVKGFRDTEGSEFKIKDMGISQKAYSFVVDYLYLSDEKRKEFVSTLDKTLLLDVAKLADYWGIDGLSAACDEELCNSLDDFNLEEFELDDLNLEDLKKFLAQYHFVPKFSSYLGFIKRVAGEGDIGPIIKQLEAPASASQLAAKCTPEEIALFSTFNTVFGNVCRVPFGAFGKEEWEKTFPVTIEEVPPLPPNIHELLEMEDPYEPGKKMKETCMLFLRPKNVILHGQKYSMKLGFRNLKKLAGMGRGKNFWQTGFSAPDELKDGMSRMPVAPAGWVLMRRHLIPETRNKSYEDQQLLLKGNFEVPKAMDVILFNILSYVGEGKNYLLGLSATSTRCQECNDGRRLIVGGDTSWSFSVRTDDDGSKDSDYGLSGSWKF